MVRHHTQVGITKNSEGSFESMPVDMSNISDSKLKIWLDANGQLQSTGLDPRDPRNNILVDVLRRTEMTTQFGRVFRYYTLPRELNLVRKGKEIGIDRMELLILRAHGMIK
eukprot:TRINITY_DN3605_c0_g1_i1.p1 TRINITY_DN3605_c0_g1~~TRINITY_DN3605_c0_g1_i1.p1  ORF type:complete len:111 (-),score=11.04 TRINITY_DN3605_c0_g1_i1:68-400(-)